MSSYQEETTEHDTSAISVSRCTECDTVSWPPTSFHCLEPTQSIRIDGRARVEVFTEIYVAPRPFVTPYLVAYLRLIRGPRIVAQLSETPNEETTGGEWMPLQRNNERDPLVYAPVRSESNAP